MNTPKLSILLFSSVFILSACSTAPTSQNIGKNIGTAMILGGLAYGSKDKDSEDSDSSSKGKDGGAIALAGLAVHFLIARSEKIAQGKIDHKRAVKEDIARIKKKKEDARIAKINKKKIDAVSKYYKESYSQETVSLFLKYVEGKKYTFSPSNKHPKSDAKNTGYPIYLNVTLEPPYKSTLISTISYLKKPYCTVQSKAPRRQHDGEKNLIEMFSAPIAQKDVTETDYRCKNIPVNIHNKRIAYFKKIKVDRNKNLYNIITKRSFESNIKSTSDFYFGFSKTKSNTPTLQCNQCEIIKTKGLQLCKGNECTQVREAYSMCKTNCK